MKALADFTNYRSIKWILFTTVSLTVPSLFFLVMAVMFFPAVFFVGGIVYAIPKLFNPKSVGETFWFIFFMGVHLLIYAGVYYGISVLLARGIARIRGCVGRGLTMLAVCSSLIALTRFKIYGGGGHGPIRWQTLFELSADLNRSYGEGTVQIIYGATGLLLCGCLWFRNRRSKPKEREISVS